MPHSVSSGSFAVALLVLSRVAAAQAVRIDVPLPRVATGEVVAWRASDDGRFLFHAVDPAGSGAVRLVRTPLDAPGPLVDLGVSIFLPATRVIDFETVPDGSVVVYRASSDGSSPAALFAVAGGGTSAGRSRSAPGRAMPAARASRSGRSPSPRSISRVSRGRDAGS